VNTLKLLHERGVEMASPILITRDCEFVKGIFLLEGWNISIVWFDGAGYYGIIDDRAYRLFPKEKRLEALV
jgi:hypothetical protein